MKTLARLTMIKSSNGCLRTLNTRPSPQLIPTLPGMYFLPLNLRRSLPALAQLEETSASLAWTLPFED